MARGDVATGDGSKTMMRGPKRRVVTRARTAPIAGTHALKVEGAGGYPYSVVLPVGWYDLGGQFIDKHDETGAPRPVLGLRPRL